MIAWCVSRCSMFKKCRSETNQMLDSHEQIRFVRDNNSKSTEAVSITDNVVIADLEEMSPNMEKLQQNQCTPQEYRNYLLSSRHLRKEPRDEEEGYSKMASVKTTISRINYISDVNTRHSKDPSDDGWITGGVMLDNNMLSVVDSLTYSVKIIDLNINRVISCMILPTRPWDITRVERDQIVVVCNNKLVFIQVGETLSVLKEVNMSGNCCGIVYTNNTLVVSFLNPGCVKILDLDGHITKTISTDDKGQSMFEEPCNIAMSPDQKTLYVSDEDKHNVTSMDLNGTVQRVYKRDTLESPHALAVDREGDIYIAGRGPNNMHIISPYCTTIKILHEGIWGVNSPSAMIYCKRDNMFYISHFEGFSSYVNKVSTYQIK